MCAKCDDGVLLFSTAPTLVATVSREQIKSTEEKQNPNVTKNVDNRKVTPVIVNKQKVSLVFLNFDEKNWNT